MLSNRIWRVLSEAHQLRRDRKLNPAYDEVAEDFRSAWRTQERVFMRELNTRRPQIELHEKRYTIGVSSADDWSPRIPIEEQQIIFFEPDDLFQVAIAQTIESMVDSLDAGYLAGLRAGANQAINDFAIGLTFDRQNPRALAYTENRAAAMVSRINETTRGQLRTVIRNAVRDGKSYQELASDIRGTFQGFRTPSPLKHIKDRAELVAVTEIGDAFEHGTEMMAREMQDLGQPMEKAWLTVGDERVDSGICGSNEGQGWIPLNETFGSGHTRPLGHPGCRCTDMIRVARAR